MFSQTLQTHKKPGLSSHLDQVNAQRLVFPWTTSYLKYKKKQTVKDFYSFYLKTRLVIDDGEWGQGPQLRGEFPNISCFSIETMSFFLFELKILFKRPPRTFSNDDRNGTFEKKKSLFSFTRSSRSKTTLLV